MEGETLNFTVTQDAYSSADTTVTVNLSAGSADAGADYTDGSPYTVVIPAGDLEATLKVDVPTVDDAIDEPQEDFTATITNVDNTVGATIGTASAIGLINDNDATPTLEEIDPQTVYESGLAEGTQTPPNSTSASGNLDYEDLDGDSLTLIVDGSPIGPLDGSAATEYNIPGGAYGTLVIRGDGSWTYELTTNVSHDADDTTYVDGEFDTYQIAVTDGANTSTPLQPLTINIADDLVQVTEVSGAHIANEPSLTLTGDFNVVGADQPYAADLTSNVDGWNGTTVLFADSGETSGGETVYYYVDPADTGQLLAVTDPNDLDGSKVFTLTVDPSADSYNLETFAQLDAVTNYEYGTAGGAFPSGPVTSLTVTDGGNYGPGDVIPPGETAMFVVTTTDPYAASDPDLVNGSNQGFGVDSNWVNPTNVDNSTPETLVFDFANPEGVLATQIGVEFHGGSGTTIEWTAFSTDGSTSFSDSTDVGSAGILELDSADLGFAIDRVEVTGHVYDSEVEGDDDTTVFRVDSINYAETSTEADVNLEFGVDVEDSDGDSTSATIYVEFDGDNVMTGAYGNEVFVGGPEAESIYANDGDGLDTIFYDESLDSLVADAEDEVNST